LSLEKGRGVREEHFIEKSGGAEKAMTRKRERRESSKRKLHLCPPIQASKPLRTDHRGEKEEEKKKTEAGTSGGGGGGGGKLLILSAGPVANIDSHHAERSSEPLSRGIKGGGDCES